MEIMTRCLELAVITLVAWIQTCVACGNTCNCGVAGNSLSVVCTKANMTELGVYFKEQKGVGTLYFTNSGLEEIPEAVCLLRSVTVLYFDGNKISAIDQRSEISCAARIRKLSLNDNNISVISKHYFSAFSSLEVLDISRNRISRIHPYTFLNMYELLHLDLSYNKMEVIDAWAFKLPCVLNERPKGVLVNISHNHIKNVINTVNFDVKEVTSNMHLFLDVRYNNITSFDSFQNFFNIESFGDLRRMLGMVFLLKHNPYKCDCGIYEFMKFIKPYIPFFLEEGKHSLELIRVKCASPERLCGRTIIDLELDQFQCTITQCDIEDKCKCVFTPHNNTIRANCEDTNMNHFPRFNETISFGNYELYMANNNISEFESESIFHNTTILDLTGNNIHTWREETLNDLGKLQILLLQNNKLEILPKGIDKWTAPLTDAKFGGNPFACNCTNHWFKTWVTSEIHPISDLGLIICKNPSWNEGLALTEVPFTDFVCYKLDVAAVTTSVTVLTVLMLVTILTVYIKRKYVYLILFTRCGWRFGYDYTDDDNKEYDVFISYSNQDEEHVKPISDQLEEYEPPFHVCLHYRDFVPGASIAENIINSIQSSKCTIIMVSNNFLQSQWCMYEFKQAHFEAIKEHTCKVILVMLEDIDDAKLDPELQVYIKTRTYIKTADPQFFSRLLMGLPVPSGKRNPIGII